MLYLTLSAFLLQDEAIVCLEEVDHFDELQAALADQGVMGFFEPKTPGRDGCAIFFPRKRFEIRGKHERISVGEGSQVALAVHFLDTKINQEFVVAVTHLKAKAGFETVRQSQALHLCEAIEKMWGNRLPVFVIGDFNDVPTSLCCSVMRDYKFQSAYAAVGLESYSTSKIRESLVERCIDYIWFRGSECPVQVLEIPPSESLGPNKLPSEVKRKKNVFKN